MKRREYALSRISLANRRYAFTRGGDDSALEASLSCRGLIDPPDVRREGRRLVVIRGFRRLRALRRLGHASVTVCVYEKHEITPFEAWSMNFHDTLSRRRLNTGEFCTAIGQLVDLGLLSSQIVEEYFPLFNLAPTESMFKHCMNIMTLGDPLLDALAEGTVTFPSAFFLTTLPPADRRAAFRLLLRLPLTVSQQREWTRLLGDLASLKGTSVRAVLASAARAARGRTGHPGPALLQILRERRYPALAAHRRDVGRIVKGLRLPSHLKVETHPFFEKDEVTFHLTAGDQEAFDRALRRLQEIRTDPLLGDLLPSRRKKKGRR